MTNDKPIKGPFRTHDHDGRQIVQVSFRASFKTYAYRAPDGAVLAVGDWVRTPATEFSPEGGTARVRRLGSEYARELTDLVAKISKEDAAPGREASLSYDSRNAPSAEDVVRKIRGGSRYDDEDNIDYSGPGVGESPGDNAADHDH